LGSGGGGVSENSRAYAREFLFKSIEDAQGTIRSLDAKAGLGVVVLGAMLSEVVDRDELVAVKGAGLISIIAFAAFAGLAIVAAALALKALFPMVNPAQNVSFDEKLRPPFFVGKLKTSHLLRLFSSRKKFATLAETHSDYCAAVRDASSEDFEKVLAAEVLKLSFIRQLKNDRVVALGKVLTLTLVAFVVLVFVTPKPPRSPVPKEVDPFQVRSLQIWDCGRWASDVLLHPKDVAGILQTHG
jgi:hypothetical protein